MKSASISARLIIPFAALGTLVMWPFAATAAVPEQSGIYLGGGIGYDRIEGEDFTGSGDDLDDSRVAYKGLAGFRLNRMLAIEGQYIDFGTAEDGDNRVSADGWTAGAVLTVPMFEYVNPYAKAGVLFWDSDSRFPGGVPPSRSDDGSDFTYGVGARFSMTDNLGLRLEYERFEMNDIDVDMASANIQFDF